MPVKKLIGNLNTKDLIGSRHKTPRLVGYIDHQQPTHDKPTSFARKQILGKKKKLPKTCWNFNGA
jgi:hypothetical protein